MNITEVIEAINANGGWNFEALAQLCKLAGLEAEWEAADGETFEAVAYKAAEILNVAI